LTILGIVWRGWIRFATILGNIQMIIMLSVIYWIMLTLLAIPFKLLTDPLGLRRPGNRRWIQRQPISEVMESMRRQG